jgi:DNA repair protein RecN (Recombination protein N)
VVRYDESLGELSDALASAQSVLSDLAYRLRDYGESLEADPQEANTRQARLDVLKRLRRKYGADEAEVLEFWDRAQRDLDMITDADATEEELAAAQQLARERLLAAAGRLTAIRRKGADTFAADTARHLRDLAMDRARFSVSIRPAEPTESGADEVEFFFSANLGEDERPLAKIASGGEISRVMLAIKSAMAGRGGIPTLIFDEVDAGLSGRAASAVARKLAELAENYQVLVITHSPQIAAVANHHIRIEKVELNGRVVTRIVPIPAADRAAELARMMTGDQVTEAALTSARELLSVIPGL